VVVVWVVVVVVGILCSVFIVGRHIIAFITATMVK
jgi:hypothetical protein